MYYFLLFGSLLLLFYSLTGGTFPDIYKIKNAVIHVIIPAGAAIGMLIFTTALFGTPMAGLVWAVLGWFLPCWVNGFISNRKKLKLQQIAKSFITSSAGLFAAGQTSVEVIRAMSNNIAEPFKSEFQDMIAARNMNPTASFPRLFENVAEKYDLPELKAVAAILSASEGAGGPYAASKGLKKLGNALRQRDRLRAERNKAIMEPKIAAFVVIMLLMIGLVLDVTTFRGLFEGLAGKLVLTGSSVLVVGLIFITAKVMGGQNDLA